MADKKYLDLIGLGQYDAKIKTLINGNLTSAKDYADGLADNYEVAGAAATALENAKAYADGKDAAIAEAKKAGDDAQTAANTAQEEIDALEGVVAKLDAYVGDIPEDYTETNVIAYINKKAEETLNAASGGSSESAASVLQALNTYKAENDPRVAANATAAAAAQTAADDAQDDIDAFKETYATDKAALVAEDARIVGLVEAEAERAAGVEEGLEGRIETMEAFWASAQADGTDSNVIDTLKEIQDYIASDETGASEMAASIKQNSDAISAMDTAYKAADSTLQGNIDALSETVDTKASDLTALTTRVTTAEGAIDAVEGRMDTAEADINALQALFDDGEGSVADQIANAVAVETEARQEADEALQTAINAKAAASDLTDLAGRVTTAETNIGKVQTDVATKAAQSDLAAAVIRISTLEDKAHDNHENRDALDRITNALITQWNEAYTKAHALENIDVLAGINSQLVTNWNAAESNAKSYTDEEIAKFTPIGTTEIDKLFSVSA